MSKDLFNETLFDSLGWHDRDWSRRLGGAADMRPGEISMTSGSLHAAKPLNGSAQYSVRVLLEGIVILAKGGPECSQSARRLDRR